MRAFALLSLFVACSTAAPQYGYQQPLLSAASGNIGNIGNIGHQQQSLLPAASGNIGNIGGQRGGEKYLPPPSTTPAPIVNKKFYLVSAPEDHSNDGKVKHLVLGRPQKNYRVVFIKAPNSENSNVKYSAEFAPQEEKTVIYVLSKKDNDLDVGDIATPAPTQPSKPEVFFIKYKTDEEAQQAQKDIQGQYDKLGGTNEYNEEANAPITSIVGSLDSLNPDGSYNYRPINNAPVAQLPAASSPIGNAQLPSSQYLPALLKH